MRSFVEYNVSQTQQASGSTTGYDSCYVTQACKITEQAVNRVVKSQTHRPILSL